MNGKNLFMKPKPKCRLTRAAALEVLMLVMDRQHLKALSNIKGEPKRKVLDDVDTIDHKTAFQAYISGGKAKGTP